MTSTKKAGYTPGPWHLGTYKRDEVNALAVWPESVKEGHFGNPVCLVAPYDKIDERDEANAAILAQSPRMVEALQLLFDEGPLYSWANERGIGKAEWDRRKKVIDKAESILHELKDAGVIG